MLKTLKQLIPSPLKASIREAFGEYFHASHSYAQEGEDLVLRRLFEGRPPGLFVDVGAHHPFRFSNTYLLYRLGWRGINIDARPGGMAAFDRHRPRDLNLELGVSITPGDLTFHVFEEPALNTFDAALAQQRLEAGWPLAGRRIVRCEPLSTILARELPRLHADAFDLLSIDVEGLDLQVLRSCDWTRHRPGVVVVEVLATDLSALLASDVTSFLAGVGYRPYAKLVNSAIFVVDGDT